MPAIAPKSELRSNILTYNYVPARSSFNIWLSYILCSLAVEQGINTSMFARWRFNSCLHLVVICSPCPTHYLNNLRNFTLYANVQRQKYPTCKNWDINDVTVCRKAWERNKPSLHPIKIVPFYDSSVSIQLFWSSLFLRVCFQIIKSESKVLKILLLNSYWRKKKKTTVYLI